MEGGGGGDFQLDGVVCSSRVVSSVADNGLKDTQSINMDENL